jgi:hypothetical protein
MPFQSESQRRAFHYLESLGKIPKSTVDEWEEETPDDKKLPEHKRPSAPKKSVLK